MGSETLKIPVIDLHNLGAKELNIENHDSDVLKSVGSQIKDAFSADGFCYLKNRGVDQSLIDEYMKVSKDFFEEPDDTKQKFVHSTLTNFWWISIGKERVNPERPGDYKEAFNFTPYKEPEQFAETGKFRELSKIVFEECTNLADKFCDALSIGLGLDREFLRNAHKDRKNNQTILRTLFYPPLPTETNLKPGQIWLGEHSDYGTITLLFQDNIGGLEVNIPDRGYVPATPIPGTVLVNIGDLMQRWTADKLVATKHRVVIPEDEFRKRHCRQSVAYFLHPDNDFMIKCLDGSDKYEPISSLDYLEFKLSKSY